MALLVRTVDKRTVGEASGEGIGDERGTGGSTSSCTLRSAEVVCAAKLSGRAVASIGVVDDGAAPYFFLHSAVVCVVDRGWFVHEPAGCLSVLVSPCAGFAAAAAADAGAFLPLPEEDAEEKDVEDEA